MSRSQQTQARQLYTHASTLGIVIPKPVLTAYKMVENVRERAARFTVGQPDALGRSVADALARDVDPTTDPEVIRVVVRNAIQGPGVAESAEAVAFTRLQDLIHEHSDQIVTELRKPFDQAALALSKAHTRIGDIPLEDSAAILRQGNDIAAVWAAAIEASKTIESAVLGWVALSQVIRETTVDRRWLNLRLVTATATQFDDANLSDKNLDPWGAVLGGFELSLPTIAEYDERQQAIIQGRADRLEAAESGRREATRRPSLLPA